MLFPEEAITILRQGKLAVIPTDTLYGVVCSALDPTAVERLYRLRGRAEGKPCIVLIDSPERLADFGIVIGDDTKEKFAEVWPGKVSVVFDCPDARFEYLHRGVWSLAFRVPDNEELRTLVCNSGPLLAPSANPEGMPPARTIDEARAYFGDRVEAYVDGGSIEGIYSTVARLDNGQWTVLRPGAVKL